MRLKSLEEKIAADKKCCFTILSLLSTVGILFNSVLFLSSLLGIIFSSIYFLINSLFVGRLFFEDEDLNFRTVFGFLLLLVLIATGAGAVMFLRAMGIFPIPFDIRSIVAILSSITIVISLINHIQIRVAIKAKSGIIVKDYRTKDYRDIIRAGYPFSTTRWGRLFDIKLKILDAMQQMKRKFFVAYIPQSKKSVGIVTLTEINSDLWGIWDIFVSPAYRRRGISSLLYQSSFDYLRKKCIRKAVGSVETTNIASIRGIEKMWDGFLPQKFYEYHGNIPRIQREKQNGTIIRCFHSSDRDSLFDIYKQCACEDWISFLEIDKQNFLDRFIQYPFYRGLLKVLFKKQVLVAEENGSIRGYAIIPIGRLRLWRNTAKLYFFLSPQLPPKEGVLIINKILNLVRSMKFKNIYMFSINKNEKLLSKISSALRTKFDLKTTQNLVSIKKL